MTRTALAALLLTACSTTTVLRRAADVTEVVALGSVACDAMSTRYAVRSGRYFETNPMIGSFPADSQLAGYFGTIGGVVAVTNATTSAASGGRVASLLRIAVNLAVVAVEVDSVGHNGVVGVPLCGA